MFMSVGKYVSWLVVGWLEMRFRQNLILILFSFHGWTCFQYIVGDNLFLVEPFVDASRVFLTVEFAHALQY